jgi:hypothetical protein
MTQIHIAGIVLDAATLKPLPGVKVLERFSAWRQRTDANGFYSLTISSDDDEPKMHLQMALKGYSGHSKLDDFSHPKFRKDRIFIDVLYPEGMLSAGEPLYPPRQESPSNPTYEDARGAMEKVVKILEANKRFYAMKKARPEISLFYVTRQDFRRLVLYRDGRVESYGGPDEPDYAEMDRRYAPLPSQMVHMYKARPDKPPFWQSISGRVQQDFHPTGGDAKAIVFPGDGAIIVIPATGEAEVYEMIDMDHLTQGRSAFEARYGKLPDYVPAAIRLGDDRYQLTHNEDASYRIGHVTKRQIVEHVHLEDTDDEEGPDDEPETDTETDPATTQ